MNLNSLTQHAQCFVIVRILFHWMYWDPNRPPSIFDFIENLATSKQNWLHMSTTQLHIFFLWIFIIKYHYYL